MPAVKKIRPFRLKITDDLGNATYLVRDGRGHVSYFSGNETSMALSNLVQDTAAELRFKLEDTFDGASALKLVQTLLDKLWAGNVPKTPKVVLLSQWSEVWFK